MKVVIIYNPQKAAAKKYLPIISERLKKQKINYVTLQLNEGKKLQGYDLIIALGGDGTILNIAKEATRCNIPVAGINIGKLGFLTEFNTKNFNIEQIKNYKVSKRNMLTAKIIRGKSEINCGVGLNDCVIRATLPRAIYLKIYIEGNFLNDLLADGIIIATSTGSTAYSLASFGPIIQMDIPLILLTPISPHTLSQRSIVLKENTKIEVVVPKYKSNREILLSLDGQLNYPIYQRDRILITSSKKKFKLLFDPKSDRFKAIKEKLKWGAR